MLTLFVVFAVIALGAVVFGVLILAGGKSTKRAALDMNNYMAHPSHGRGCPRCGAPLPAVRKPANMRQMLFGGWSCPHCKAEVDSSGRLLS